MALASLYHQSFSTRGLHLMVYASIASIDNRSQVYAIAKGADGTRRLAAGGGLRQRLFCWRSCRGGGPQELFSSRAENHGSPKEGA